MPRVEIVDDDGQRLELAETALLVSTGSVDSVLSLDAVTANADGAIADFGSAKRSVSMFTHATGAPTTGTVTLHVSADGVNWIASTTTSNLATAPIHHNAASGAIRYARAVLSNLTGGTAPTVTTRLMAS